MEPGAASGTGFKEFCGTVVTRVSYSVGLTGLNMLNILCHRYLRSQRTFRLVSRGGVQLETCGLAKQLKLT